MKDPRPEGGAMRTPQLYRSLNGTGQWELVDAQIAPDEPRMCMHHMEFWHGRMFVSDARNHLDPPLRPRIHVAKCVPSGTLSSDAHDFEFGISSGTISWDAIKPPGTVVKFQIRSAKNIAQLQYKTFMGPDGRTQSFYTESGTKLWSGHKNDTVFQYCVTLRSADNGRLMPVLSEARITVDYISPDLPNNLLQESN
jgi:hypothetical protein